MAYADVDWLVGARLRRLKSALLGSIAETKLRQFERALKANFDPNQPRVPAGNPDGGQWTGTGGGGGTSGTSDGRVAQIPPRRGRRRAGDAEATRAQLIRRDVSQARAREAIRQVNEIDPNWKPRASATRPNSIQGQIATAEGELREAETRLRELARLPADSVIDAFRRQQGLDLLGEPVWSSEQNTVAMCKFDGGVSLGVNSDAPRGYTEHDRFEATQLRTTLIEKHPHVMSTDNVGKIPNDSLFHAETTCLLRAARANGGTLEGQTVELYVDRPVCRSCLKVLPFTGLELGNPTVTIVEPNGRVRIMRDGVWIR